MMHGRILRMRLPPTNAAAYHHAMSRRVCVHLLPELFEPEDLRGGVAVVIDVLRASTTIISALAAGASAVIPVGTVDEAQRVVQQFPSGTALLGGERGGMKIPGFDLGNSPDEYVPNRVGSQTIVFTTTNGTKALLRTKQAHRVFFGAFANIGALVAALQQDKAPIHLICAGSDGHVTREDVLFAGEVIKRLPGKFEPNDAARIAMDVAALGTPETIHTALQESLGGANLRALGQDSDIAFAAKIDRFAVVPELSTSDGRIVLPAS